jgi:hypothetical protein
MKKNQLFLTLSLIVAVWFSILFQSFDSIAHLQEQFFQKKCHHTYNSTSEFTHQHHSFDHCFICNFGFSSCITPLHYSYSLSIENWKIPCFFSNSETVFSFTGSLYSYRGPPKESVHSIEMGYFSLLRTSLWIVSFV